MLTSVTEEGGTGTAAAIPGVRVAGKTGTAQKAKLRGRGYDENRWVGSFIGFAPAERPEIVVTVIIDEPAGSEHQGNAVAAPVFRRVTEETLRYLGRLRRSGGGPTIGAPLARTNAAVTANVNPATGGASLFSSSDGGMSIAVPSIIGMTARRAVTVLAAQGLEAELTGAGTVVRQSPAPGEQANGERRVRVELEPGSGAPRPMPMDADGGVSESP
jgi:membrane peptidoglycan carboxypeptidase